MSQHNEKLNIVDEKGNVIGEDTRYNIHKKGLLHREINVFFFTPAGEIVFQKRGKNKDTYPGLLDSTVGGHVDLNETFEQAALKEIEEETGLKLKLEDLIDLGSLRSNSFDKLTKNTNNALKRVFAYQFKGKIKDLKVEKGKADGFEKFSLQKILSGNLSVAEKEEFIPTLLETFLIIFKKIDKLILEN